MKLRREHIIAGLVLLAVFTAIGAVYQFYYKQRLAEYNEHLMLLGRYEKRLGELQETFQSTQPDALIASIRGRVVPLEETMRRRAEFFNTGDWLDIEVIPEGKMLKFYYADEFNKALNDLRQETASRNPYFTYPDTTFGAARPEEFEGRNITAAEVSLNLRRIKFGCSMVRMLLDAKAPWINRIEIWPKRAQYGKLLVMRTIGLHFGMKYSDLVAFVDSLRMQDRYFSINAISIQNHYLRWPVEPPVEIKMLLTQADFNETTAAPGAPAPGQPPGPGLAPGSSPLSAEGKSAAEILAQQGFRKQREVAPPTRWEKTKRWLRNHYLWPF